MRASVICLFSESDFILDKKRIDAFVRALNVEDSNIYLSRLESASHNWNDFQNAVKRRRAGITVKNDITRLKVSSKDVSKYFVNANKKLALDFGGARSYLHSKIFEAVSNLDEDIRRQFLPSDFSISIGWHDIYEALKSENGHLFGRASISIRFWGWMHPAPTFENVVMNLEELRDVANILEPLCGRELSKCFYME